MALRSGIWDQHWDGHWDLGDWHWDWVPGISARIGTGIAESRIGTGIRASRIGIGSGMGTGLWDLHWHQHRDQEIGESGLGSVLASGNGHEDQSWYQGR